MDKRGQGHEKHDTPELMHVTTDGVRKSHEALAHTHAQGESEGSVARSYLVALGNTVPTSITLHRNTRATWETSVASMLPAYSEFTPATHRSRRLAGSWCRSQRRCRTGSTRPPSNRCSRLCPDRTQSQRCSRRRPRLPRRDTRCIPSPLGKPRLRRRTARSRPKVSDLGPGRGGGGSAGRVREEIFAKD